MSSTRNVLRVIIEMDGVLFAPRPVYWEAYSTAASEVGTARTTPDNFWRFLRSDAPRGQWVPHADQSQLQQFSERFDELIEASECLAKYGPHDAVRERVQQLGLARDRVLVTAAPNRTVRQELLKAHNFETLFLEMAVLSSDARRRTAEMRALSDGHPRTVLVAATETVVRAGHQAGLLVVGCSSGHAIGRRLTQAGADWAVRSFDEFVDDVSTGCRQLQVLGLPVAPR